MLQLSLFPDGSEHLQAAQAALEELRIEGAVRALERARAIDSRLPGLQALESATGWLDAHRRSGRTGAAELLLLLREEYEAGATERRLALQLEELLSRRALREDRGAGGFVDAGGRLHRAALLLALGRDTEAALELERSLAGEHRERAELWALRGDAGRAEEPEVRARHYLRAFLLDARAVDLFRLRHPELLALHGVLAVTRGDAVARELIFPHGWLRGLFALHAPDPVVDTALPRLRARAAQGDPAAPEVRARRFALLLYEDLAASPAAIDLERRERMAELEPALFAEMMRVRRTREERAPRKR